MDQNQYPRPDAYVGGVYPKDKTWGTVIMVLSAIGVCCGVLGVGAGGLIGALGATGAAAAASGGATNDARGAAAAAGVGGGIVMILGIGMILSSIIQLVGGYGITKSQRWGFLLTGVLAGISILLNIPGIVHLTGIVGIAISGVILYYCYTRLSGKEGPTPV